MNRKIVGIAILLIVQLCLAGCTGQMFVLNPEGDQAKITLSGDFDIMAELLAVNDSILYVNIIYGGKAIGVSPEESLVGLELDGVSQITVQGYTNKRWILPWVGLQVVPPILLGFAASSVSEDGLAVWGFFSIPAVISGIFMGRGSSKKPEISNTFTPEKISELKKYTRYPLGLNDGQLRKIAESHGQQNYRVIQYNDE
jgi:hypothetical protein